MLKLYKKYNVIINSLPLLILILIGYLILNDYCHFFVSYGCIDNGMKLQYFGFSITAYSIFLATQQYRKNHLWNKQHIAIQAALDVKKDVTPAIDFLSDTINYRDKSAIETYKINYLHDQMCVIKNSNSEDPDERYEHDSKTKQHKLKQGGGVFAKHLGDLLNKYEYIAAGVAGGIFDEEIIRRLYKGPLCKCYTNFAAYIEHYNKDMAPDRNKSIWIELKLLAEKWKSS